MAQAFTLQASSIINSTHSPKSPPRQCGEKFPFVQIILPIMADGNPPSKRRKLDIASLPTTGAKSIALVPRGLNRPISPPAPKNKQAVAATTFATQANAEVQTQEALLLKGAQASEPTDARSSSTNNQAREIPKRYIASPIQLTRIEDMSPVQNVDCISLRDILGDPMIKECWNFNYLFDIDFVMQHFDPDVKGIVNVKIVHGFWKKEDERRIALLEAIERYPNVESISAYIPDPFGTHHTKMMILLRHDDLAQVIIHTANMISRDWGNMTQAVWRSPLLPLSASASQSTPSPSAQGCPLGSGERFGVDLLRYINAYGYRINELMKQLIKFDFSAVRAAFIGSVPSRQNPSTANPAKRTSWGWLGVREILSNIPITNPQASTLPPHIVMQVSSIATLGQTPTWMTHFQSVLAQSSTTSSSPSKTASSSATNFFSKRSLSSIKSASANAKFNIIFPTADEIRNSLDGYASGASIHMKLQSNAQQKQFQYLRPLLCHWEHSESPSRPLTILDVLTAGAAKTPLPNSESTTTGRQACRGRAAPHIKTYIRFSNENHQNIDWAMVTSANLSKQAWGDTVNKNDEVWIQSWEAGVVVWPEIFDPKFLLAKEDGPSEAQELCQSPNSTNLMVPVFGKDDPEPTGSNSEGQENTNNSEDSTGSGKKDLGKAQTVVGFRMPYDLPLSPYKVDEIPWCATLADEKPDWRGMTWRGYGV